MASSSSREITTSFALFCSTITFTAVCVFSTRDHSCLSSSSVLLVLAIAVEVGVDSTASFLLLHWVAVSTVPVVVVTVVVAVGFAVLLLLLCCCCCDRRFLLFSSLLAASTSTN